MPVSNIPAPKGKLKQEEIIKCGVDPLYFLKRYGYITHPKRGLIKFTTYPFQDDCVRDFESHRFNIVLKSRQLGLSTICAGYCLWMALFQKEKNIVVIATKLDVAKNFFSKIIKMYDNLPDWLVMTKEESRSVKSIKFTNGSRISAIPTGDDAGRGEGISLLIVDEAAHIQGFDDLWMGLYSTVSTGGNIILLSTPKGVGNVFHKTWVGCDLEKKENDFHGINLPWTVHPEHDESWFKEQCRNLDARGIQQELLCVGPDTKIVSKDGYVLASAVKVGDEVLTHRGRFRRVVAVQSRQLKPEETLWKVSSPGNRQSPFYLTGNHPVLSYKFHLPKGKSQFKWFKYLRESEQLAEAKFESLDELAKFQCKTNKRVYGVFHPVCPQDMFSGSVKSIDLASLVPGAITTEDGQLSYYPNQMKKYGLTVNHQAVDYELGRFLGLAMAEGCLSTTTSKTGNKVLSLQLAFHSNEDQTLVAFVENFYKARNISYRKCIRSYSNCITLTTCNKFAVALYNLFVDNRTGATTKAWRMDQLLLSPPEFVLGCLVGHFEGDGDHPGAIARHNNGNKVKLVSKSKKLLYQTRTLLSAWGHYPRMAETYLELDGLAGAFTGQFNQLIEQTKLPLERAKSKVHLYRGEFIGKFSKEVVPHTSVSCVYDIEVEEDHSFVAEGLTLHNCSFLGSGHTYIPEDSQEYIQANIQEPIAKLGFDRNIWVWKYPETDHKYVISADVARGDSDDYSTAHVIDTTADEVVAEYQGKIPPDRFAELLIDLGQKYCGAMICPENNSFGLATAYRLRDLKYPNIYYEKFAKSSVYQTYSEEDVRNLTPGITTTVKNRQAMLAKLEEVLRNRRLKVYSSRLAEELKTFVWNPTTNKASAMKGYNDDLIMSIAIGCYLYEANESHVDTNALNAAMLAAWGKNVTQMNPAGYSNQQVPDGEAPLAFQRVSHGSAYNHQNGYYNKPFSQQNMKPGVSAQQARPAVSAYNAYSWLFDGDPKPKKEG